MNRNRANRTVAFNSFVFSVVGLRRLHVAIDVGRVGVICFLSADLMFIVNMLSGIALHSHHQALGLGEVLCLG